jgi:hypothetical protein
MTIELTRKKIGHVGDIYQNWAYFSISLTRAFLKQVNVSKRYCIMVDIYFAWVETSLSEPFSPYRSAGTS